MDQTLRGDFISCPEGVRLPSDLWKANQPNNKMSIELCSVLDLSGDKNSIGIDDMQCFENSKMICQVTYYTITFFYNKISNIYSFKLN
jgi:hypothetical protein